MEMNLNFFYDFWPILVSVSILRVDKKRVKNRVPLHYLALRYYLLIALGIKYQVSRVHILVTFRFNQLYVLSGKIGERLLKFKDFC